MCENKKKIDTTERRDFLKKSALGGLTLFLGTGSVSYAQRASAQNNQTIISIFLRGGFDALSACGPLDSSLLKKKRPDIRYKMRDVGDRFFGVNSSFGRNFFDLYDKKEMAILHGVGGLNSTTSHFSQMDYIEGGDSKKVLNTGFLARFSQAKNIENMFAIESEIPHLLKTNEYVMQLSSKQSLNGVSRFDHNSKPGLSRKDFLKDFFNRGTHRIVENLAQTHNKKLEQIYNQVKSQNLIKSYGNQQMGLASEMIAAGNAGTYTLSIGGWDHHSNLKGTFTQQANALFDDLAQLVDDLKTSGKYKSTTIVVHSEFGRRIGQNGAAGCDHGRGGIAYILGGRIRGGKIYRTIDYAKDTLERFRAHEDEPKLNLKVEHDIRQVYAQVFKQQFNLSNSKIKEIFNNDPTFKMSSELNFIA